MMKKKNEKLKEKKSFKVVLYFTLRLLVILIGIRHFFQADYGGTFICILTLILFLIPSIVEKRFNVDLPDTLEVIIYLFIFSAEILGELNSFYLHFEYWDTMLHTINGFIMAAIGFALVNLLNNLEMFNIKLSPIFVTLTAFCFSMTTGIVWEFFEYGMDTYFGLDMQKDTVITDVTSVMFDETNSNISITEPIDSILINGEDWNLEYGGYIDIGLHDTMKDLFVNFLGAVVFSIIGWFYLTRGGSFVKRFLPIARKKAL